MNTGLKTFVKNRFKRKEFFGLPLTVLLAVFIILAASLLGITDSIVNLDPIVKLDAAFSQFLFSHRTPGLAKLFYSITHIADQTTVAVLLVIMLIYFFFKKQIIYVYAFAITFLGAEATAYLTKILINRDRPGGDIAFYIEHSKSFPSGHSTVAVAFFGFLTYYLIRSVADRWKKNFIISLGVFLILLIGFSRIYLGVHYVSDVLGGFLVGSLWLILGIIFRERHFYLSSLKNLNKKNPLRAGL